MRRAPGGPRVARGPRAEWPQRAKLPQARKQAAEFRGGSRIARNALRIDRALRAEPAPRRSAPRATSSNRGPELHLPEFSQRPARTRNSEPLQSCRDVGGMRAASAQAAKETPAATSPPEANQNRAA